VRVLACLGGQTGILGRCFVTRRGAHQPHPFPPLNAHNTQHQNSGGPARYVLAGSAEIGDALYGKMAVLAFARASDVESGAFRLLGANQRPVALRAMRGGCKGLLGMVRGWVPV
jgi:hypothetical protein